MWRSDTKLEEMTLPEERVLEKLSAVSTAKRLANMVRHQEFPVRTDIPSRIFHRNSTTPSLARGKRFERPNDGRNHWRK